MSPRIWRWVQIAIGLAIVVFSAKALLRHDGDPAIQPVVWGLQWPLIAQAIGLVLIAHLATIWSWLQLTTGWREPIDGKDAAIFAGRMPLLAYWPGKDGFYSRGMIEAKALGLSTSSALSAAVLPQMIVLGVGFCVGVTLTAVARFDTLSIIALGAYGVAAAALIATVTLSSPWVAGRLGVILGRPEPMIPAEPEVLGASIFGTLVASLVLGLAVQRLSHGTLVGPPLPWTAGAGAYATAVVMGTIFSVLPAGLLVREAVFFFLIKGTIGGEPAVALAFTLRALTLGGDLVIFLLVNTLRRPTRVVA